jgi:hypothetical protein
VVDEATRHAVKNGEVHGVLLLQKCKGAFHSRLELDQVLSAEQFKTFKR